MTSTPCYSYFEGQQKIVNSNFIKYNIGAALFSYLHLSCQIPLGGAWDYIWLSSAFSKVQPTEYTEKV